MRENLILPANGPASALRPVPTIRPQRILVADVDPYICHLSAEVLIRQGYEVNAAEDGTAAWEELQANPYNLLITEHDLPKITGVKLVRKLRAAHMALPVVMAAGKLPARELARNPSLQLAATLVKPFAVDALLNTVKIVLRATDILPAQLALPTNSQIPPSAEGWQLKPDVGQASSTRQVRRESDESIAGYFHWGLND